MFGCCVAGRLLQTNLQQVDETHALFELPDASQINHICLFLLGTVAFPEGYGATVHFFWPGKGFQLLGMLSNDKPSAIFRLRGTFTPSAPTASSALQTAFSSPFSAPTASSALQTAFSSPFSAPSSGDVTAILGLSIEPLPLIASQIQSLPPAVSKSGADITHDPTLLAERIVKHLFNYASGFVGGGGGGGASMIPMSVFARWYESFSSKLRAGGVGFLERGD